MKTRSRISITLIFLWYLGAAAQQPDTQLSKQASVIEILQKNCISCHNDSSKTGGLSMQRHEGLLKGGAHGAALTPGRSAESRMVLMIEGTVQPRMPMDGPLSKQEILAIREWIDSGAPPWSASLEVATLDIPRIRTQVRTEEGIASLAFRPDGNQLAVGTYKEVRLLSPQDRQVKVRLSDPTNTVRALAFSPDGSLLAAAGGAPGQFGEVKIWDTKSNALLRSLRGHSDCIYAVRFSLDGAFLATASYDRLIKLWDVGAMTEVRTLKGHIDAVFSLAISPDGKHLASASSDRSVKIWDIATGKILYTLSDAGEALSTVTFHQGGRFIAAGGADKKIWLWKFSDQGVELVRTVLAHSNSILQLTFAPDGRTLVSAGADGLVKLWDAESLREKNVLDPQTDWVLALTVSPNGKLLAVGRYDGSLAIYELKGSGI